MTRKPKREIAEVQLTLDTQEITEVARRKGELLKTIRINYLENLDIQS